jgi:gluconokinase
VLTILPQYHPQSNIDKMANGIPLTDDDRWDWLETIRNEAVRELEGGAEGCVVTCSCLKRKYRDIIRLASREADDVVVRFVYLRADKELLLRRVRARQGHYMKDDMIASQFEALEEPDETESDVIPIDVGGTLDSVISATMDQVHQVINSQS